MAKGIGKMIRDRGLAKKMGSEVARKQRSGHRVEPHASSVDRTEQNPAVQSSDYHAQTPRSTWQPTQGLVGPGLVYSGPNQPTPQQDAAPVLHHRPLNLHPHHRYLPIGKEMNKRGRRRYRLPPSHARASRTRATASIEQGAVKMHEAGKCCDQAAKITNPH
jgi:hypothetical protein